MLEQYIVLAQALHHNSTLLWRDLQLNSISDDGAVALAQALHHNSTLWNLKLHEIGEEGTCQLVEALTVNTSTTRNGSLILPTWCEIYATQCPQ